MNKPLLVLERRLILSDFDKEVTDHGGEFGSEPQMTLGCCSESPPSEGIAKVT